MSELSGWLEQAYLKGVVAARLGTVTGQIPELAGVDPSLFALSVVTLDGAEASIGDTHRPFSLQSLTKRYALWLLLDREPSAWEQVGWGPSEASYGSVAVLEHDQGRPRNPFVNAGALVVTDRLLHHTGDVPGAVERFLSERSAEDVLGGRCGGSVGVRQ